MSHINHYQVESSYNLNGDILSNVDPYPYCGVTVSSDLEWHNHTASITKKATRTLNFVRRNIYNCPSETKAVAYASLVRPHLEYAVAAWDHHLDKHIHQREMVQRHAAQFIHHDYHHSASVTSLLDCLHWPPLVNRKKTASLCLFYKSVHNLSGIPTSHLHRSTRLTRNSDDMTSQTLLTRTEAYKF
jgi:hypothetical protein